MKKPFPLNITYLFHVFTPSQYFLFITIFKNFLKLLDMSKIEYGKIGSHPTKNKIAYRITIKLQSWINAGFFLSIKRKQDLIDKFNITEPYSERSKYPRIIKK